MAKRSNGEGTFTKTTTGWRLTLTIGYNPLTGDQKRKVFNAKTQKECKEKYEAYKKKQSFNTDNSLTLGSYFHNWLFEFRKNDLKPSSFAKYEGVYRNYIASNEKLAKTKLVDISTLQLQKYYNAQLEIKSLNVVKSINRYLSTCLSDAVKQGYIINNPCSSIKFPKNIDVEEDVLNYIDEDQQKILISAMYKDDLECVFLLGLACGLRLGEILALEYKDFDFNGEWININKSLKKVPIINSDGSKKYIIDITKPKTKSGIRKAPLPQFLVEKIHKLHKTNLTNKMKLGELYFDSNLLFCNEDGTSIESKRPTRRLKSILKKCKIDVDLHFHSLRHIFISNCINHDVPPRVVMSWVGHSDITTTMNTYAKISDKKLKDSSNTINKIFESII